MARAHYLTYLLDTEGRPVSGATVTVREPGTATDIAQAIYAEDSDVGNTIKQNPFTGDADGRIEVYLDTPQIVDVLVQKTGFDSRTIRGTVLQLTASDLTLHNDGTPLDQQSTINFSSSFVLTDDVANSETEVALNFGEAADIATQGYSDTAVAGSSGEPADAGHKHGMPANPVPAHESTYNHADIASGGASLAAHLSDTTDAHDASAISVADAGALLDATNVETALAELASESGVGLVAHEAAGDPHTGYQLESQKGAASGYVPLNGSTMIDHAYYDTVNHGPGEHDFDYGRARRVTNVAQGGGGVWTDLPLTEDVDGLALHSNSTNPERWTITAGVSGMKFVCTAQGSWEVTAIDGTAGLRIVHVLGSDGITTTVIACANQKHTEEGESTFVNCTSYPFPAVTGDYFKVQTFNDNGSNMVLQPTDTWFSIYPIGS